MRKYQILLFTLVIVLSCENSKKPKEIKPESEFEINEHYSDFSNKLENGDTLSMIVNLSVCMWEEYDLITFTKEKKGTFLEIKKIVEIPEDTFKFPKKTFRSQDGKKIKDLISEFDINNQDKTNSPFFIISQFRENDTVLLRTTGLTNRINAIEKYQNLITDLYPQEMDKYKLEYQTPPPPSEKTKE